MPTSDPGPDTNADGPPAMPGWVKAVGIVLGLLLILLAVVVFTGAGGEHGPGRHAAAQHGVVWPAL